MKNDKWIEELEDIHDALIADLAYEDYLKKTKSISVEKVAKEYDIETKTIKEE